MFISGECMLMCTGVLQYSYWFWGKPQHQHHEQLKPMRLFTGEHLPSLGKYPFHVNQVFLTFTCKSDPAGFQKPRLNAPLEALA